VILIASVSPWFLEHGFREMLKEPEIAVYIVPFDLVSSRGGSPKEVRRKR
jgi:hypothetical protein